MSEPKQISNTDLIFKINPLGKFYKNDLTGNIKQVIGFDQKYYGNDYINTVSVKTITEQEIVENENADNYFSKPVAKENVDEFFSTHTLYKEE